LLAGLTKNSPYIQTISLISVITYFVMSHANGLGAGKFNVYTGSTLNVSSDLSKTTFFV